MPKQWIDLNQLERAIYDAATHCLYNTKPTGHFNHQETINFTTYITPTIQQACQEWARAYNSRQERQRHDDWHNPNICNHTNLQYSNEEYGPTLCLDCGKLL